MPFLLDVAARVYDIACGRLSLDGPTVPFEDPGVAPQPTPAPPSVPAPASGPAAAPPVDRRHGSHRNDCTLVDTSDQACCGFAEYLRRVAPRAPGCTYATDPWHRCVAADGQPSTITCHASVTRRTPQEATR